MAGKARFSSKAKDSILGGLVDTHITDGSNLMNALEFIESPAGCGIKLYPVQRILTKLIFGIPMDWNEQEVPVYDMFCDKLLYTFKETEYIHYAGSEGRLHISDWKDANPEGYNEVDMIVGRRGGKLLGVDELIPTPNGFVRNGDLQTGDEIFGEDGKPHKILLAHPIVQEQAYKVSFDDGTFTYAHGGHLWHTFTRKERKNAARRRAPKETPQVVDGCWHTAPISGGIRTTEEILRTLKDFSNPNKPPQANHSVPLPKAISLPRKELPVDPYCLGAWLGDGHYRASHISGVDAEILAEFSKAGYEVVQKSPKLWLVRHLVADLRKLGVYGNKHIPKDYLWASEDQRLALLQGLMDTDGSCMKDGECEFSNTNRGLSEGVYHLASSLGLKPHWAEKTPVCCNAKEGKKQCKTAYIVSWTGTLPVFRLPRKLERLPKKVKSTQKWRYIVDIEPAGQMSMRCITVENPTGLYLFGRNFNVTHNSLLVAGVAAYKLYRLLSVRSPQEYFGLVPGSPIDITLMAQDGEGSARLYDALKACVQLAPFFGPYVKHMGGDEMTFVSEADRNNRDITPSIKAAAYACLDERELIWTPSGLRPIKDILVGDKVFDHTATPQEVMTVRHSVSSTLQIEATSFKNDPLILTPTHQCVFVTKENAKLHLPFLREWRKGGSGIRMTFTSRGKRVDYRGDISVSPADQLKPGDYFLFPQIPLESRSDTPLDTSHAKNPGSNSRTVSHLPVTPEACRLYGLYLAEGSIVEASMNQVVWTFHLDELATLAQFVKDQLQKLFNLPSRICIKEENKKCSVICCSKELAVALDTYFSHKSNGKTLPPQALSWSQGCQTALINGYMEGDGCRNRSIAPTVSQHLAYSLFNLAIQAGLRPSTLKKPAYEDKNGISHQASWYLELCKQDRHCRFYTKIGDVNYYWIGINKIVKGGPTKVVDIEVANTHTFLTKMGATHNCTTNAVRGPSSYFLALDEFAFYRNQIGSNSDEMYEAASPATMQFKAGGVREGKRESMIFIITSPANKIGKYYSLFKTAMQDGASSPVLAFQCGTAEMNPRSDSAFLKKQYRDNPEKFMAEYGGKFLEASETFVKASIISECIETDRQNVQSLSWDRLGHKYFWGLDLGTKHDATALAVSHWEGGNDQVKLVVDYVDRLMIGEGKFAGFKELPLDEILAMLKWVNTILPCFRGATDQYGGSILVQLMTAHDIKGMELVHLTSGINSQMYLTLKTLMENRQISLPDDPRLRRELGLLEAAYTNKYQIKVAAPSEKDAHDDMADAVALSAYMAQNWAINEGKREIQDIMLGIPQNIPPGVVSGGWDNNASLSYLASYERQLRMQLNPRGVVQNPWRRR